MIFDPGSSIAWRKILGAGGRLHSTTRGVETMTDKQIATRRSTPTRTIFLAVTALLIVTAGGIAVWTNTCPCNRTPGFVLLGDVQETPVTDWGFVNDAPLCQIQI